MSEDPAKDGWNWFQYGRNNPLKYIDPTGLDIVDEDENGEIDFGGAGAYGTSSSESVFRGSSPSINTKVVQAPEVKSPNPVKYNQVLQRWVDYLGFRTTSTHPRTGLSDLNRIFSVDGTRSIRFGNHEMNSIETTKFHYHEETWTYDAVSDTMMVTNTLVRIQK